jgi:hypothetical protein
MTLFGKKCAVGGGFIFAIINTIPVAYFSGFRYQEVNCLQTNITVQKCGLREFEGASHTLKLIYVAFEIIVIFSNIGIMGFLYILIGLQIFRRFKLKESKHIKVPTASAGIQSTDETNESTMISKVNDTSSLKEPESNAIISSATNNESSKKSGIEMELKNQQFEDEGRVFVDARVSTEDIVKTSGENPGNSLNPRNSSNVNKMTRKIKSTKRERNRNARNNFTYMFLTIIVCYILSYLPTIVTVVLATGYYSMGTIELNVVMLMRNSSIINHIVNPIIYGYFDIVFRKVFMKSLKCRYRED